MYVPVLSEGAFRGHRSSSQANYIAVGQDTNCAILAKHLKALGVSMEFETELIALGQDENIVTAALKSHGDGTSSTEVVRAAFVLGADGARGMRPALEPQHCLHA